MADSPEANACSHTSPLCLVLGTRIYVPRTPNRRSLAAMPGEPYVIATTIQTSMNKYEGVKGTM